MDSDEVLGSSTNLSIYKTSKASEPNQIFSEEDTPKSQINLSINKTSDTSISNNVFQWKAPQNYNLSSQFIGNKAKGRISKPVLQENKTRKIFRKKNVRFSENLACFVFLKHPF